MSTYYDIFFIREDLKVDDSGRLSDPACVYILAFDEDGSLIGRVDPEGRPAAFDIRDADEVMTLTHLGEMDFATIREALARFDAWLDANTEWAEVSGGTLWEPPEYACIGVQL